MTSKYFDSSTYVLFISVMKSGNGSQVLNIACLLFLSPISAASSAPDL